MALLSVGCDACLEQLAEIILEEPIQALLDGQDLPTNMDIDFTAREVALLMKHSHGGRELTVCTIPGSRVKGASHPAELRIICQEHTCQDESIKHPRAINGFPILVRIPLQPPIHQLVDSIKGKQVWVEVRSEDEDVITRSVLVTPRR